MSTFQIHHCFPRYLPHHSPLRIRWLRVKAESVAQSKTARIIASKKEAISFPIGTDSNRLSEFFKDTAGVEALLNTRALHSYHPLPNPNHNQNYSPSPADSFVYRCTLFKIQFLNFEVTPVLDLRVTSTEQTCTVELLSYQFQGLDILEQQSDLFSASMRNHITWREDASETFMDFDVNLELTLAVTTKPFSVLPLSAVEKPGNLVMQGVLDRLVPLLIQQLLQDYNSWLRLQQPLIESSIDNSSLF